MNKFCVFPVLKIYANDTGVPDLSIHKQKSCTETIPIQMWMTRDELSVDVFIINIGIGQTLYYYTYISCQKHPEGVELHKEED